MKSVNVFFFIDKIDKSGVHGNKVSGTLRRANTPDTVIRKL